MLALEAVLDQLLRSLGVRDPGTGDRDRRAARTRRGDHRAAPQSTGASAEATGHGVPVAMGFQPRRRLDAAERSPRRLLRND